MWYAHRNACNYRTNKNDAYKIGYAESNDGVKWIRFDDNVGVNLSLNGWDSQMMSYPNVIKYNSKLYMFYNGNGFGQTGFGYAVLMDQ